MDTPRHVKGLRRLVPPGVHPHWRCATGAPIYQCGGKVWSGTRYVPDVPISLRAGEDTGP